MVFSPVCVTQKIRQRVIVQLTNAIVNQFVVCCGKVAKLSSSAAPWGRQNARRGSNLPISQLHGLDGISVSHQAGSRRQV
jgi:hypothetical protein